MSGYDILIIGVNYAPEVTGIAPYTTAIARGLAGSGHRVQVITGFPHYPSWTFGPGYEHGWRRPERDGDVEVLRVRHPLPRNSVGSGRVLMEAVFAAQAAVGGMRAPDAILVMSPALLAVTSGLMRRWRSGRRSPAVGVVVQDLYSRAFLESSPLSRRGGTVVGALERHLLSRADGVCVIHDKFRDALLDLGIPTNRVTTIRNWSHITPSVADPAATRRDLGWAPEETIVLHAGNQGHKQGLDSVVEAARLADSRPSPVRFVLMGDGARRPALEQAARGVDRLTFLDPLPAGRFEDALAAADLLLLNEAPGVVEMSVPSKLTSYFAAGRPVLAATDVRSGAASEVEAAAAGLLVAPGDPRELLAGVERLLAEPAARLDMERKGRAYAAEVLQPGNAIAAYSSWIEGLARSGRRPLSARRVSTSRTSTLTMPPELVDGRD